MDILPALHTCKHPEPALEPCDAPSIGRLSGPTDASPLLSECTERAFMAGRALTSLWLLWQTTLAAWHRFRPKLVPG